MNPIKVERRGSLFVASPQGDIDAANASQVRDELAGIADGHVRGLILDLSEVAYLDSAAIEMLFRFSERLRQRHGSLRLVIPRDSNLIRLLDIVGLPSVTPVHATVQEALAVGEVEA